MLSTVNAFYLPIANSFAIAPWFLAGAIYQPHQPKYLNFGSLGTLGIGHEMIHGFDNNGREYNHNGNQFETKAQK